LTGKAQGLEDPVNSKCMTDMLAARLRAYFLVTGLKVRSVPKEKMLFTFS
jgi:hypothetical protein